MKKYINISLVIISGIIVLYHRMIEPLALGVIILPMIAFSLIMVLKYRKIHRQTYFHLLAIFVLVVNLITIQDFAEKLSSNQIFSSIFFAITIAFFVSATVVELEMVEDRNIKKRINKVLYLYASWILIFHSPITEFLTILLRNFAAPLADDISDAISHFWLISDITYIIVVLVQVYVIYLTDKEHEYRKNKAKNYENKKSNISVFDAIQD
ncbi:hypothetical protein KHQ88_06270 [Mycoplasmatota bacterium]|nr:hypothetical protein KHQ88_06270 [Mycoplasmatota bacterium]